MVTVFTSIYNRKKLIKRLYSSLQAQTNKNFEWIVIDDGSTDDVFAMLKQWEMNEKFFSMKSFRVENGGKHRAINQGVKLAKGEALFIVDSDDYITEDAIDFIESKFKEINNASGFAGISGLRYRNSCGKIIGGSITFDSYVDATNLEREKYGLLGDKAEVYKTSILKKYPFPEYEGENFITEEVVWNRIAHDGLKVRWFNKVIYYCDYLDDGLTKKGHLLFERNPYGWAKWISDADICNYWDEKRIIIAEKDFYLHSFDREYLKSIEHLFFLHSKRYEFAKKEVEDKINNLREYINDNTIKEVAIYGYGSYGKTLHRILDYIGVPVPFVIDRRAEEIDSIAAISESNMMKNVDSICISLKNKNLVDGYKVRKHTRVLWSLVDIIGEFY